MAHLSGQTFGRALLPGILAASLLLAGWLALSRFIRGAPALRDFLSFYSGAVLLRDSGATALYVPAQQQRTQARLHASAPFMPYVRPPLLAAALVPLTVLPLFAAATVWVVTNGIAAFALGLWAARRARESSLLLLLAVFPPLLVSLLTGQDTPLLVLLAVAVLLLTEAGRQAPAGLVLALLWVKPTWLAPFVLLLAARRQWRALGAFAAATAVLWAVFPPVAYARFLLALETQPGVPACVTCMPNIRALAPGPTWTVLVSAAVLIVLFVRARRLPLPLAFASACAAAVLAGYYSHVYDCLLLAPAIALAAGPELGRARAAAFGWALSPLPWLAPYWHALFRPLPALTVLAVFLALVFNRTATAKEPCPS